MMCWNAKRRSPGGWNWPNVKSGLNARTDFLFLVNRLNISVWYRPFADIVLTPRQLVRKFLERYGTFLGSNLPYLTYNENVLILTVKRIPNNEIFRRLAPKWVMKEGKFQMEWLVMPGKLCGTGTLQPVKDWFSLFAWTWVFCQG